MYAPDETAVETGWPDVTAALWTRREVLRYGENPHQRAALYVRSDIRDTGRHRRSDAGSSIRSDAGSGAEAPREAPAGIAGATQLHGKAMSYNNYVDAAAAWRAAFDFVQPCVAIIKHSNPCGIALGTDLAEAHRKANACDPESAFGGVIAANGVVTAEMAAQVKDIFTEIVIAPGFEDAALDILSGSKNLRLLTCPPPARGRHLPEWRQVDGGLLLQTPDEIDAPGDDPASWELKTGQPASADMLADLAFAWRAIRSVKSNAILLASGLATVGVGMGQVNRVDAARLAVSRAGERAAGSVAASDAYFPFPDGLEVLTSAGIRAVVAARRVHPRPAQHRGGRAGGDRHVRDRRPPLLPLTTVLPEAVPQTERGARCRRSSWTGRPPRPRSRLSWPGGWPRWPPAACGPAWAPSWSGMIRAAGPTSTASTGTAPRWVSPASAGTCPPTPPRSRSRRWWTS